MTEHETQLLEKLAGKLGTTTEYLWGVLMRQAPIDAVTTLFQFVLIGLFGYALYRLHKKFSGKIPKTNETYYERYDIGLGLPLSIGAVIFAILCIMAFFCISDVVNGFFNPEYWALKEVLSTLKD